MTEPQAKKNARRSLVDLPISTTTPVVGKSAAVIEQLDHAEKILVNAPRGFTLTLDDGTPCVIRAGVQSLPRHLAEHWYAKAFGVAPFDPDAGDVAPPAA